MSVPASFMTTRWSLVVATDPASPVARRALDELCRAYAGPLLVHARRSGIEEDDANDAVQGFLAQLLERGGLHGADQERGRFRAYLLGAFSNFMKSEARRERALKRGGGEVVGSLDALASDKGGVSRLSVRPYDPSAYRDLTPEAAYDRAWASEVIRTALEKLGAEYAKRGREHVFQALKDTLDGGADGESYAARAEALGSSTGAVKVAAHRMRTRLGELIRAEVADTLDGEGELGSELDVLFRALGGSQRKSP